LLDTHIAFWLISDSAKLRPSEYALLKDAASEVSLSVISLWELRIKWHSLHRSGDRKGPIDPIETLAAFRRLKIPIISLESHIAATALLRSIKHRDPFDELLLVQAQELSMFLFTRDKKLKNHPLAHFA
jgi:PIN domain nuclease of toxin-antitoxin system